MATAVSKTPQVLGSSPLGIGGRSFESSRLNVGLNVTRVISDASASGHLGEWPLRESPLSGALDGRCEYYSTTHQSWIPTKVSANDAQTGAVQIDKKPGVWMSPADQKFRLRVTQASVARASKDRQGKSLSVSTTAAPEDGGELGEASGYPASFSSWPSRIIADRGTGLAGELGTATPSAMGTSTARFVDEPGLLSNVSPFGAATTSESRSKGNSNTRPSAAAADEHVLPAELRSAAAELRAAAADLHELRAGGVDLQAATPVWETLPPSDPILTSRKVQPPPIRMFPPGQTARAGPSSAGLRLPEWKLPSGQASTYVETPKATSPVWEAAPLGAELGAGSPREVLRSAHMTRRPGSDFPYSGTPVWEAPLVNDSRVTELGGASAAGTMSARGSSNASFGVVGGTLPLRRISPDSGAPVQLPVQLGTSELTRSFQQEGATSFAGTTSGIARTEATSSASPAVAVPTARDFQTVGPPRALGPQQLSGSPTASAANPSWARSGTLGSPTVPLRVHAPSATASNAAASGNSAEPEEAARPAAKLGEASRSTPEPSGITVPPADPAIASKSPGPLPLGDAICYDEHARPTIVRQINPDSGAARTIVLNDDGSHRVFGEHTVASLTNSAKDESKTWIDALSSHQLRGLVHEVGQRLLEGSRLYHARLNQLEKMGENLNYIYFGLTADASDRDLENAYRKLAKKLHPDKNGGTEAAKKRFQQMKERYEAIKKKRNEDCEAESDDGAPPPESEEDEDACRQLKDRRRKDKDDEDAAAKEEDAADKASSIEYDPQDRESMEKTVGKMLGQLKNVEIQMKVVVKELGRIGSQLHTASAPPS